MNMIKDLVLKAVYKRNSAGKSDRHKRKYSDYMAQYRQNAEDRWGRQWASSVSRTFRNAGASMENDLRTGMENVESYPSAVIARSEC
jgi:hypothetical protein